MASLLFLSALCVMFLDPCASEESSSTPMPYSAATDLLGQMFSVNKGGSVYLRSDGLASLSSFTVCLRHISEPFPTLGFFELNLGGPYSISLTGIAGRAVSLTVGGKSETFQSFFPFVFLKGPWTILCATWESGGGMAQVFWNSMPSVRKGMWQNQVFSGRPVLTVSGFVGQITDVHVWDYVLSTTAIVNFCKGYVTKEGTVLSWRKAQYSVSGYVVLEQVQFPPWALPCKPWEQCWRKEKRLKNTAREQQVEGRDDEEWHRGSNKIQVSVL